MSVRAYYDRYWTGAQGESEARRFGSPTREEQQLFQRCVLANDTCLDVGCGDGISASYLDKLARSCIGVDVSSRAVEIALGRGIDAREIDDAAELPFPDQSFDVVVCFEVLEHLFDPLAAARETRRLLKPGGRLLATIPNASFWRERGDMLLGYWEPSSDRLDRTEPWRSPHIRFFHVRSLTAMLEAAGFSTVVVTGMQDQALFARMPGIRKVNRQPGPSARALARRWPTLFAPRLAAVAS
jgi:methionine biosynthesis protein MetW